MANTVSIVLTTAENVSMLRNVLDVSSTEPDLGLQKLRNYLSGVGNGSYAGASIAVTVTKVGSPSVVVSETLEVNV